jgi:glycosyltransferase involved in cell wall biosynthesis
VTTRQSPDLTGLRVLAFCDYLSPRAVGGSERATAEIYRRIASWGAQVSIVAGVPDTPARRVGELGDCRVVHVPAVDLSRLVGAQVAVSLPLWRAATREYQRLRPHVVTTQSIHFHSSLVAAVLQQRTRTPLVSTVHVAGIDNLAGAIRVAVGAYEGSIGRYILSRSRQVIAVSEPVRRHVARLVDPGRLVVVPNGVDHELFLPGPERVERATPRVAFVGRLIANKGPSVLVEALGLLAEQGVAFEAEIMGDGPQRAQLEARVAELELSRRVRFSGSVPDVADRLRRADVFVRPSTSEGMSLALLEAMATGLCVVASDIPANAALVDDGRTGLLVPTGNAQSLATALRAVLVDPGLRHQLATRARPVALRYSWDACAASTAKVVTGACKWS